MRNNFYFLSSSGNAYCYNREQNVLYYAHPLVRYFKGLLDRRVDVTAYLEHRRKEEPVARYSEEELRYYLDKTIYLNTLFKDTDDYYDDRHKGRIYPQGIRRQLANLKHITFEVTESCNLKCSYCGYGKLYNAYDPRNNIPMSFAKARNLIDYLVELWRSNVHSSHGAAVYLSFYGGEPLMNMPLVRQIVEYVDSLKLEHIKIVYNMTTNAVYLNKYMDYLVDHQFKLLISIDGSEYGNSYRAFKNGKNSHRIVYNNIKTLQKRYPEYFKENVAFNAVLHNRNSVADIFHFITEEFNKIPQIGELNTMGVHPEQKEIFLKTYRNTIESLHQSEDYIKIERTMFVGLPETKNLVYFLHQYAGNVYKQYSDFFIDKGQIKYLPTGTCFPFSRKLFVTTNGKILACERIAHHYALGHVTDEKVDIDFDGIAQKYNDYYERMRKQCDHCFNSGSCSQCIFYIDNLDENPICKGYCTEKEMLIYFSNHVSAFEQNPGAYKRIMNDIVIY